MPNCSPLDILRVILYYLKLNPVSDSRHSQSSAAACHSKDILFAGIRIYMYISISQSGLLLLYRIDNNQLSISTIHNTTSHLLKHSAKMARSKDTTEVQVAAPYLPFSELSEKLLGPTPIASPLDHGTVSLLVLRPEENGRRVVDEVEMSIKGGMAGSGWVERPERGNIDQICVMSTASIRTIAGEDPVRWPAAGDQMFMDLDLGKGNFATGDRVCVGREGVEKDVVLEVTGKPHNGCAKFAKRYGSDALKVVNAPLGKQRRLRGIYFSVVREGVIRTGDRIVKIGRGDD